MANRGKRIKKQENSAASRSNGGSVSRGGAASRRTSRRKGRRGGNNILWYLLILVFMVSVTLVLTTTVFFKIKTITVAGCERYDHRELIISSGILLEENMFKLKDKQIKEKLTAEYSYIAGVKIKRRLPDTIVLEITEATPMAAIDAGVGYTLIDERGRVLETNSPILPENLPVIFGFSENTPPVGSFLDGENSQNVKRMQALLAAIEQTKFGYYDMIDLSDEHNIKLYYQDIFEIVLGTDGDLVYKLELTAKVIEEKDLTATFKGTIDASTSGEVWTRPTGSVRIPAYTPAEGENSAADSADSADKSGGADDSSSGVAGSAAESSQQTDASSSPGN